MLVLADAAMEFLVVWPFLGGAPLSTANHRRWPASSIKVTVALPLARIGVLKVRENFTRYERLRLEIALRIVTAEQIWTVEAVNRDGHVWLKSMFALDNRMFTC